MNYTATLNNHLVEVTVPSHINPYISSASSSTSSSASLYSTYPLDTSFNGYYPTMMPTPNYTSNGMYNTPHYPEIASAYNLKKKQHTRTKSSPPHPYLNDQPPAKKPRERRHRKAPHELLTEEQKKANHIASEQKRRQNIKIGFDQLIDIVPTLNHGNKSEALILQKSVDHIRHLITLKNQLKNHVRYLQGTLGETDLEEDSSEDELVYF